MNAPPQPPRAALCLLIAAAALGFGLPGRGQPDEVYLDHHCSLVGEPQGAFRVDYRRTIRSGDADLWFAMARFQDGAAIFCLSRPGYGHGRLLAEERLQRQFIREIRQERETASFLITVARGNGRGAPLVRFRLDLSDPERPLLVRLDGAGAGRRSP
jgi:hypothetical protein